MPEPGIVPYPPRVQRESPPLRAPRPLIGNAEGFMIQALGPILSVGWRWLYALLPTSDRPVGFWIYTPYGAVSTREISIFVPGVSEL